MRPSNFPLSNVPLTSAIPEPKTYPTKPFSVPNSCPNQTSEPETKPEVRKPKGSAQLNRWSRARAIRSGRRLDRPINRKETTGSSSLTNISFVSGEKGPVLSGERSNDEDDGEFTAANVIYMVSDGTGWTAEHSVNAALGQFEHCLVDRGCAVNTHLFSGR
eukprot:TRINITY_DN16478_c1_g1_i2.p1 TRINITY_DN16478_c1_g1~~TRINITY_DN16478_c1_g1_i2.p1  ORF type:complete len:188 (+),score=9.17 TRINITY_DN16478_c1_g1_i2:84-566(+)